MTYLFYPGYVREHHIETTEKIIVFLTPLSFLCMQIWPCYFCMQLNSWHKIFITCPEK